MFNELTEQIIIFIFNSIYFLTIPNPLATTLVVKNMHIGHLIAYNSYFLLDSLLYSLELESKDSLGVNLN